MIVFLKVRANQKPILPDCGSVKKHFPISNMKIQPVQKARFTLGAAIFCGLLLVQSIFAQNTIQFTGVTTTSEGAITLSWASNPGELYEIDYADAVADISVGGPVWKVLYDDYPSHGASTFCLDTGNYFSDPTVPHPNQMPMRYYRVVVQGTDTTPTEPVVSITSPGNGTTATGTLTVTVTASTDQALLSTKLYVDGQEMQDAANTSNYVANSTAYIVDTYVLNSSEWPNGPHTFFATVRCQSGASGPHDGQDVLIGHGVSPLVPINFSNLITRISFSEPFFAPEDGQTQLVSAVFAANVNWTLQIQNASSNTVRTVTGNGDTMQFAWDGTGGGGSSLPVGYYTYFFTAQTNGLAHLRGGGSGGGGGGGVPMPSIASTDLTDSTQLWAIPADGPGSPVPFGIYPPGFDTSSLSTFEAPMTLGLSKSIESSHSQSLSRMESTSGGGGSGYSGAASQASRAPVRPPINPVRGRAGVFGVAYQTYSANGRGFTLAPPDNGLNIGIKIGMEGHTPGQSTFLYKPLALYKQEANNFMGQMKKANWSRGFAKVDDNLAIDDLRSSGANVFNQVKLGLLMLHGTYGSTIDYKANQAKQMYFPNTGPSI